MNAQFIDSIRIFFRSGNGGAGSSHFLRNKLTAKGGPDGGDGGRGGNIILQGDENLWTLYHLRYNKNVLAENGENGSANKCSGKTGKDMILKVPLGTIGIDEENGQIEVEVTKHNQQELWIQGGRGGLGNAHFATPTNQAPRYAQPGEKGWEGWKRIELKLLADVGLVGFPNVGKSTLLSTVSSAKPKIADYPFTTLAPQPGIVSLGSNRTFCIADLPGIIEGASEGKGLGFRFLRHIERNAALAYVISSDSEDAYEDFCALQKELRLYNPLLLNKAFLVVLSKSDIITESDKELISKPFIEKKIPFLFISAASSYNIEKLKEELWKKISIN